jgi:prepilin-type processing-associated H-X9-DG protein
MKIRLASERLSALTRIEVIVVVALLAVLAAVLLSGYLSANAQQHAYAFRLACQSTLKSIGIAFRTWDADHDAKYPMSVSTTNGGSMEWAAGNNLFKHFQVMSNELINPIILLCPSDNDRHLPKNDDFANFGNSNLSYFVGLDADETRPGMLLAGDRNLVTNGVPVVPGLVIITTNSAADWSTKMHNTTGNFLLADGRVQRGTGPGHQVYISRTGTNANRLAVP